MEVPDDLKLLYKHWEKHTHKPTANYKKTLNQEVLNSITRFASERMLIWEKKQHKSPPPYTKDSILANYRFCNIYRELDRQTIAIHRSLKHLEDNFPVWLLNILFQRMVCRPETVDTVGTLSFEFGENTKVYEKLLATSRPRYGAAYIFPVSLIYKLGLSTREEFFCFYMPKVVKACAELLVSMKEYSVVEALTKLLPVFGLNFKFHWTEVLIDVAYQYPNYINLYKEFPIGPGSIPTMRRLNSELQPELTCLALTSLSDLSTPYLTYNGLPIYLSAENWEGIGCEFRKYTNLRAGTGRHRLYK